MLLWQGKMRLCLVARFVVWLRPAGECPSTRVVISDRKEAEAAHERKDGERKDEYLE